YGSAVEELAGDTDVIPGGSLPVRVAEQRRGVVRGDERDATPAVHLAATLPPALPRAKERGRRGGPERHEHLGPDQLDLPPQVREAGLLFLGQRGPVLRRPALHHVRDKDPLPGNLYRREDGVQQPARRTDERAP